jgi:hypothetical protein
MINGYTDGSNTDGSTPTDLHTVAAKLTGNVGDLTWVLHQETRLTDELVGTLRDDGGIAFSTIIGIGDVVFVGLGVFDDEAVLQNVVKTRLDVVRVLFVIVVFVFFGGRNDRRRKSSADVVVFDEINVDGEIFVVEVTLYRVLISIELLAEIVFEVRFVEVVDGLFEFWFFEFFVVVVHAALCTLLYLAALVRDDV